VVGDPDLGAIELTAKLATITIAAAMVFGAPLAFWLAMTRSRARPWVAATVALPLVLPPTVLGFYLLVLFGPHGPGGWLTEQLGLGRLPFTFGGLVVACTVSALPFVVQPLQGQFEAIGRRPFELAATLGAGPVDRFFTVAVPLAGPGWVVAGVLGFAHTVGEFGVVLMMGGNIPGQTRTLSVAIFDHVEALEYSEAHRLAIGLLALSFAALLILQAFRARAPRSL
jgi:molybdate transport system permease protein